MATALDPPPLRTWRDGRGGVWRARLSEAHDRRRHDAFVRAHPRGHPLQLWSWGEVKRADGWTPLRVMLERNGAPVATVSLVEKPLAGHTGPTLWMAHRGPVTDPSGDEAPKLWEALRALASHRHAVALRIDPEWAPSEGALLRAAGLVALPPHRDWYLGAMEPLRSWRISLEGGAEAVFSRCEAHTRYDIRRSQRKGVMVRVAAAGELRAFYALERDAAQKKGFALRSDAFFERLWRAWNEPGDGRLHVAEYDGRIVGGAWWVHCGQGCWGQFAAADYTYRHLLPTVALYWAGIRWAIGRGCRFCDFGGIGHIEDARDGLWAFKKGFGPGDTRFTGVWDLVFQPILYRAFRLAEQGRWAWLGRRPRHT